jgi:hypothetical protein
MPAAPRTRCRRASAPITYLERATFKAACGLAEQGDDTDGRAPGSQESEKINAKQRERLQALLEETHSDTAAFCRLANPPLDSLADMLAADFESAVRLLEQKKAKQQGKAA